MLDYKKGWYQRSDILNCGAGEDSWDQESLIKEIKPVKPNRNQSWIFIGRTDAETEAPVLATWWEELTHWKRPWRWEKLRAGWEAALEDEMVRWHDRQIGHDFEQTPGVNEGQGSLACYNPWGCKESETIERLNNTTANACFWRPKTNWFYAIWNQCQMS